MIQRIASNWRFLIVLLMLVGLYFIYEIKARKNEKEIAINSLVISAKEQSPTVSWVKDKDYRIIHVSKEFGKYFLQPYGFIKSDFVGKKDEAIFSKVASLEFREDDKKVKDCFCPIYFTNTILFKGDSVEWISVKYPVIFENGDTGVAGEGTFKIK